MKNQTHKQIVDVANGVITLNQLVDGLLSSVVEESKEEHNIRDLNEINRLTNVLRKIAGYGRNTALHTWAVPSFTLPNIKSYEVKQTLTKAFTCSCLSFAHHSGLDGFGNCKHIRHVMFNEMTEEERFYAQGAIEANNRVTQLAKDALIG